MAVTLRQARQARLLTLQALAARSGCAPKTVLTAEQGRRVPEFTTIKRLSAVAAQDRRTMAGSQWRGTGEPISKR